MSDSTEMGGRNVVTWGTLEKSGVCDIIGKSSEYAHCTLTDKAVSLGVYVKNSGPAAQYTGLGQLSECW